MLVKEWFAKSTVRKTNKHEIHNNEDQRTQILNSSTEKKRVKEQDKHSMELPWCCDTLRTKDKHMHSLDYDRQANMRKRDNLCLASVLAVNDSFSA